VGLLNRAASATSRISDAKQRRWSQVAVGNAWRMIGNARQAIALLEQTGREAGLAKDFRSTSYAEGYLGSMAEQQSDWDAALVHTGKAVRAALDSGESSAICAWEWQLGRIYRVIGQIDEAIRAYGIAVSAADRTSLESVRGSRSDRRLSPASD